MNKIILYIITLVLIYCIVSLYDIHLNQSSNETEIENAFTLALIELVFVFSGIYFSLGKEKVKYRISIFVACVLGSAAGLTYMKKKVNGLKSANGTKSVSNDEKAQTDLPLPSLETRQTGQMDTEYRDVLSSSYMNELRKDNDFIQAHPSEKSHIPSPPSPPSSVPAPSSQTHSYILISVILMLNMVILNEHFHMNRYHTGLFSKPKDAKMFVRKLIRGCGILAPGVSGYRLYAMRES